MRAGIFPLANSRWLCYTKGSQRMPVLRSISPRKNQAPGEVAALRGPFLCLPALTVPVKPLAYVVADYTRCDRHKECQYYFHKSTPFLLPVWGRAAPIVYHNSTAGASLRDTKCPRGRNRAGISCHGFGLNYLWSTPFMWRIRSSTLLE